jgi:hypothetical protein
VRRKTADHWFFLPWGNHKPLSRSKGEEKEKQYAALKNNYESAIFFLTTLPYSEKPGNTPFRKFAFFSVEPGIDSWKKVLAESSFKDYLSRNDKAFQFNCFENYCLTDHFHTYPYQESQIEYYKLNLTTLTVSECRKIKFIINKTTLFSNLTISKQRINFLLKIYFYHVRILK